MVGCHAAAAQDHLHGETQILPVDDHLRLLSAQHLAKPLQPSHPSFGIVTADPPHQRMKETLRLRCWSTVAPSLQGDVVPPGELKQTLKQINANVVSDAMERLGNNRVLQARPPVVDISERRLSRQARTVLSQLRSGHCSRLNDLRFRIGRSKSAICPDCNTADASTQHLFSCSANPTSHRHHPLVPRLFSSTPQGN